jgi:hypothetical protein
MFASRVAIKILRTRLIMLMKDMTACQPAGRACVDVSRC